jgi:hypothetical protein
MTVSSTKGAGGTMGTPLLRRVETMKAQLDLVSAEYLEAKEQFDVARVNYEVAREKFSGVRRLAMSVQSNNDWYKWRHDHQGVQYSGLRLGEAIADVLENRAYEAAAEYWKIKATDEPARYFPLLSLERIQENLERGGFEFRTATPLREVNAALINAPAETIKKEKHGFLAARADEILKEMDWVYALEVEKAAAKIEPKPDDDVPF